MNALILALLSISSTIQQISKKSYNKKGGGAFSFSAASAAVSLAVYFLASGGRLDFTREVLGYSIAFALTYSMSLIGSFLALCTGPLSITSLVFQYSLLIPTFYGLIVLDEPLKITLVVGLILLVLSLFLINKKSSDSNITISLPWIIFSLIAFVANGSCATVQKVQQNDFDGRYKSEFMIIAILISVVIIFTAAIFAEKKTVISSLKKGSGLFVICGLANGGTNLGTMFLAQRMSASVMFPIISACSIIANCAVSIIVYKERLSKVQLVGLILGILAIIAMNL